MTALESPELDQDPEGLPQDPVTPQRPPPGVLPAPKDEHDLETSINLIKQSLHERANQLNVEHLQQMASAGQMQAYDAQQMQQATGGQMEEEMALMSFGMPQTNVRVPENRQAYEDWFADMERRQGSTPEGVNKQWPEVKKRYSDFQGLARNFDSDKGEIARRISSMRNYYEGPARQAIEIATAPAKGITGGYVGTNSRQEDLVSDVKARIDELVTQRFPKTSVEKFSNMLDTVPGAEKKTPGPSEGKKASSERDAYKQLLTDEAWSQLRKTLDRPGMTPKGAAAFTEKALETLGMFAPMGAAAKGGVALATKAGLGKLAPHIGNMIGFGAYGAAAALNPEQESRIARLPEDDRVIGQVAARIENGVSFGLLAPVWSLAGGAGAKLGGGLSKALGGRGEGLLSGLLKGAGTGLTLPLAPEIEGQLKALGAEHIPALRDLVEKKLIAKPELQTPLVGMINSAKAGDGRSFLANLTTYLEEAAPGMVAFGLVHGIAGMRTAFRAEQLDLLEGRLRETQAKAEKEAEKLAGGEPKLAEQLKQGLDEAEAKVNEGVQAAAAGAGIREQELTERIGPEESAKALGEAEVLDAAGVVPVPESAAPPAKQRVAKTDAAQGAETSPQESAHQVNVADLRRQEKLLTRRIARTEDPAIKAELAAARTELRRQRREVDAPVVGEVEKPSGLEDVRSRVVSEAAEAGDVPARSVARGRSMALHYENAARSSSLSPHERAAAATKAAEWAGYHKEVSAWEKAGSHGEEPATPTSPEGKARAGERIDLEMGERASRELTRPMPAREEAAAKELAYRESEQRKVDEAQASGVVEPGHVVEDLAGHRSEVIEVGDKVAITRNPEGEIETVDLREGKLPSELSVVGIEKKPAKEAKYQKKDQDKEPEAQPQVHEAEVSQRPESESTTALPGDTAGKVALASMHSELEALQGADGKSLLRELASLKSRPGAKMTDVAKGYAEVAAAKAGEGNPVAREFLEFVAKNADLAANRHGERFTAEMVYQWQAKKNSWPADPRGESMGELTRWMQDELSQVLKEVRLTGDKDTFTHWAANQSMLLTGPWAVAARVHPDGQAILRRIAEMESGAPPSQDGGFLRVPDLTKVWSRIRNFRADSFAALLEQAHANPLANPKAWHKLTGSFFAMPVGEFGYVAKEKIASETESRAALDQLDSDFFDVQSGKLRHAKADLEVDKMFHKLLDDPRSVESRAIWSRRHTDPKAMQALETAAEMRRWNKKALAALVEVHPTTNSLKNAIRAAKRDIASLASAPVATAKAQKAIGHQLAQARSFATRLEESLQRFKESYGIKDYMRHIPRYEIVGGARLGTHAPVGGSGVSVIEAKRRVYSDITRERTGGLKAKGLLGDSGWQAVNHYMHSIIPMTYKSRFLNRIEERLYGNLERLSPRELLRGRDDVIFGELRGSTNLGFYKEVKTPFTTSKGKTMAVTTFARGKRGGGTDGGKVLLWVGKGKGPTRKQLADVKWVTQHLQTAKNPERGLVAVDKGVASSTFRAMKGGLWEHIGAYQQGRLIDYINDGRGMREQMTGVVGDEYNRLSQIGHRVARWTASWMSAIAMGGNIHNAVNNLLSGTALNSFFGVNARDAATTTAFIKRHVALLARRAAGRVVGQSEEVMGLRSSKKFDPESYALSDTWDTLYRTPKAELDKLAPEKRAERVADEDAMVGLMQSGVLGQNHANRVLGRSIADKRWGEPEQPGKITRPWQKMRQRLLAQGSGPNKTYELMEPGETVRHRKDGTLERVKPGWMDKAANLAGNISDMASPITDPIGKAWWSAFGATETAIRAPIFIHGYRAARAQGLNHSQAIAEGIQSVHLTQMVFVTASKSAFFNSPVGALLGNLSGWTAGVGGRMLALPLDRLALLAGFNVACMGIVAQTMGIHGFNLFGTTLRELPGGASLEDLAMQLGVKTNQDPQGLQHKGMIYNAASKVFDIHALPIPTPIPARFGPIVPLMENLVKAGKEAMRGNGEQASRALWQATGSIDPLRSNAMRQIYKAFGVPGFLPEAYQSTNVQEASGGAVYTPPGASKGSTVVEGQGWRQFGLEMLPGAPIREAAQWQENQLNKARNDLVTSRHKELNEQGRQLMHHLGGKKLSELAPEDQEVFKGMRGDIVKAGTDLGRPVKRSDLVQWNKDAEYERTTDARMRAALAAPSKAAKVREITRLLEDPGYNLSKERWAQLVKHVSGASGSMSAWLADTSAPVPEADRKKLGEAYKLRKSTW